MDKKRWQKPELVALLRSRPEEAVLAACKFDFISGPAGSANSCRVTGSCGICSVRAAS